MSDPITVGSPVPPSTTHSANPLESFTVYGSAPVKAPKRLMARSQAHAEISKRCGHLKLSAAMTKSLLKTLKLNPGDTSPVAQPTKQALEMLDTLGKVVKHGPKLSKNDREQFVGLWIKLDVRGGARKEWNKLGQSKPFWTRMSAKNRTRAAWHLRNNPLSPSVISQAIGMVANHHLFAAANDTGKQNALADPCDTAKMINANTLPDAATQKKQAAGLMQKNLGHMKPASRAIMHRQILAKANYLRKAFFEFKPGSKSKKLWGDRFVNAYGRDWYKQCLSMILTHSNRNACRSAFKQSGATRGADVVCGKD